MHQRLNRLAERLGSLLVDGGILLLALATLVIRYGSAKFPSARADAGPP